MLRAAPGGVKRLLPRGVKERVRSLLGLATGPGHFFHVDIINACSLRCPSCPVGNTGDVNPKGRMSVAVYEQVLERIVRRYRPYQIALYNWTEPLLHAQLPEFVRLTNEARIPCLLSTNLNAIPRIEEVLAAEPEELRISLSGFTQEIYCQTHAGGKIDRVKENMARVRDVLRQTGSRTRVLVYYHKYKHNLHEVEPMRRYARELGFDWLEAWAVYMPVEGALSYLRGDIDSGNRAFIEKYLAVPLRRAVEAAGPYRSEPCRMLSDTIVLDHEANVQLCCAVYSSREHTIGSFLTAEPAELQRLRDRHSACGPCVQSALHVYYQHYNHPGLKPLYQRIAEEETAAGPSVIGA
jgi:MoaA/NifB/PqqE/SkfB family radical SAM enzyme